MRFMTLKHSMPAGDLLSLLPGLRQVWKDTGNKWVIYQRVNLEYGGLYGAYEGAVYSIKNDHGVPVTMNLRTFAALRPLIEAQEYVESFVVWEGQPVMYDMDLLRQMDTTMPYGCINRWPWYIWPEMACDLSEPWLAPQMVCIGRKKRILINKTERYGNMLVSYEFLRQYKDCVMFLGLPHEHKKFCDANNLDVPRYEADDFIEISMVLEQCKLFIGSQSAIFQVAEGLKVPRILETCRQIPNVIGSGPHFYDFINQRSLEYYVDKLYNDGNNG